MLRFLSFALLWMFVAAPSHAAPRPFWPIPPLSNFDGTRWGNLEIGRTSFKGIQANFETGKGAWTRSTELSQAKNTPLRVDLLWQQRGDQEILSAITVRFLGEAPLQTQIEALFSSENAPAERLFAANRFEDWSVSRFAPRGLAAFSLRDQTPLLLLCAPGALETLRLEPEATPIALRNDPREELPKRMEFGEIPFDIGLSDDLYLYTSEQRRAEVQIALADAQDTLAYRVGGDGVYSVRATGSNRGKNGGSISVAVKIEGLGPYGSIRASGSSNDYWSWSDKEKREQRWRDENSLAKEVRDSFRSALGEARREAEASFARQMLKSGPPPLSQVREEQWRELIEDVREGRVENAATDAILR